MFLAVGKQFLALAKINSNNTQTITLAQIIYDVDFRSVPKFNYFATYVGVLGATLL